MFVFSPVLTCSECLFLLLLLFSIQIMYINQQKSICNFIRKWFVFVLKFASCRQLLHLFCEKKIMKNSVSQAECTISAYLNLSYVLYWLLSKYVACARTSTYTSYKYTHSFVFSCCDTAFFPKDIRFLFRLVCSGRNDACVCLNTQYTVNFPCEVFVYILFPCSFFDLYWVFSY